MWDPLFKKQEKMLVSVLKYKAFLLFQALSFSQLVMMLLVFLINRLYFLGQF